MIKVRRSRRRLVSFVTVVAALMASFAGSAPAAIAADGQSKQWYLDAMHAEEIWKTSTGQGITVAVIDTGVNPSTSSLNGQVLKGMDFAEAKGDETDDYSGHGTTMAELIAGTGAGGGLKGLAPGAKVIPFRVSDAGLQNNQSANAFDMEEAIKAAVDSEAQIISISMRSEFYSSAARDAVQAAQFKGKLLFVGVGDSAEEGNKPQYPASYPEAIAVAATDRVGRVADYSQHGDFVDLAAPGNDIPAWCDESFTRYCVGDGGTSSASALASASAALIWSAHPDWTANQVLRVMFESAARGDDWEEGTLSRYLGHGIVRPGAHINRGIGKPGEPDISPLTNEKVGGGSLWSASPAASAPASSEAPAGKPSSDALVAGSSTEPSDEGTLPGWVWGAVAATVVIGGGGLAAVRKRRSA
ncbi:S8 family serine peptidase [Streptomyces sp. NPDC015127]|uniref:S8 family serine peptidase n=1 Tax=Streptomyces sp. NPDC015127 TaxID=3364939 RepID=UPI0036F98346